MRPDSNPHEATSLSKSPHAHRSVRRGRWAAIAAYVLASVLVAISPTLAENPTDFPGVGEDELVSLDFSDVELPVVVDTISRMTGFNFIYDDRVRGRVTIVSPTQVTIKQAFAVFESVLKVKGFSLVLGPGNTYKIIPIRDVKESSIDTIKDNRESRNRDRFVTRLVPLRFIDAEAITQTIKPLISKDASLVAYAATNTIIVTDSESNIRRLLSILDALDVESYRQELSVIKIEHADATTLGEQLSQIYGAEVAGGTGGQTAAQRRNRARRRTDPTAGAAKDRGAAGPQVRILTDERTNSLLILSSRQQLADIRGLVHKLDIPVVGSGRIHVRYLRYADAEQLAETLNSLLSGAAGAGGAGRSGGGAGALNAAQSLRSVVTPLAEGVNLTADPATNSLVIQASKEAYETLGQVIEKLDISRPQVLVEALIVEVGLSDDFNLGFGAAFRIINGDTDLILSTLANIAVPGAGVLATALQTNSFTNPNDIFNTTGMPKTGTGNSNFVAQVTAAQQNNDINIVSAPHILTSDNEEAEIKIGQNIPIVTGRTQAATGAPTLSQSVNVQRQDVGVTLRVTPQISEGNTVRLEIFQALTEVQANSAAGDPTQVGVSLSNREVNNTVVVNDGETVAIGGLISETFTETETKVPFLGDIPFIGWAFKTIGKTSRKTNLLIFLTPHIVRNEDDLERETIRKRLEFEDNMDDADSYPELADHDSKMPTGYGHYSVAQELGHHAERYPIERMWAIEDEKTEALALREKEAELEAKAEAQNYAISVASFVHEDEAIEALTLLVDAGYEGSLISQDTEGTLVFTLQVGPFDDLWSAQRTSETLDEAYGYSSSVTVLKRDEP